MYREFEKSWRLVIGLAAVIVLCSGSPAVGETGEAGAAEDSATEAVSPRGGRFSVGGTVNRTLNVVDDGVSTQTYHVDSVNFPTLFYFKGSKDVSDHLTVGGHIEAAIQDNSAVDVNQNTREAGLNFSSRFFEITLDSTRYGKLSLGRGFMASAYMWELDKSDTWRYNQLSTGSSFAGMLLADSEGELSDIPIALVYFDAEGFAFRNRVRYDSPVFGGVQLSGAVGSGDSLDGALRWDYDTPSISLAVRASAQNEPTDRVELIGSRIDWRVDGGVGLLHKPTGLSLVVAAGEQNYKPEFYEQFNRTDGRNFGAIIRAGLRRDWFGIGDTKLSLDFFRVNDVVWEEDEAISYGLFVGQHIEKWHLEPYVGVRVYDFDSGPNAGKSFRKMTGFAIGAIFDFSFSRDESAPKTGN